MKQSMKITADRLSEALSDLMQRPSLRETMRRRVLDVERKIVADVQGADPVARSIEISPGEWKIEVSGQRLPEHGFDPLEAGEAAQSRRPEPRSRGAEPVVGRVKT
jgi:hypothetical protein